MKKITRITLSATCLFAFAWLWLVGATPARADADLVASITFDPPLTDPNSLDVGDTFVATISLSSATNQVIDTVGMYMTFDETIVQVNSITERNLDFCPSFDAPAFNNADGTITGSCAQLGGMLANVDVLEIEFEVLVTDTRFDLAFVVCPAPNAVNCFGAYSSGTHQIATYKNASSNPLAVTMQTMDTTNEVAMLPSFVSILVVLVMITAVGLLFYKRPYVRLS